MIASQVDISRAQFIQGWMNDRELTWLAEKARDSKIIVEFGSYQGRSTRALADNTDGIIYAVDPWNGDYFNQTNQILKDINTFCMPQFYENLKDHIEVGKVTPVRKFSYNFELPFLVDMVFIDGDHRYNIVRRDILKGLSILKPGGILSGHDYNHPIWPGVKQAVDELLGKVELEESIWWIKLRF